MKRYILSVLILVSALGVQAQGRKNIANFSLFQQYYNPALTGSDGSVVKTLYRSQWSGFEGAPRTMFASGELNLTGRAAGQEERGHASKDKASHAVGLAVLGDRFGPFAENQLLLSYASGVRLGERTRLRWGGALTYGSISLDGHRLTVDNESDPQFLGVLGNRSRISKFDLNLGLMLTSERYYLGYAMHEVTKDRMIYGDSFLKDLYTRRHIAQAGYRTAVTEQVGLAVNGIYQYDRNLEGAVEGQLKAIYRNMFWVGGGYRRDEAYSFNAGLLVNQLRLAYAYEVPTAARYTSMNTSEVALSFYLAPVQRNSRQVVIW
ncbi:type IX secretion system membrane protein PorP/SprF [Pontibacter diazotrophicus]|uniref:Type IX secretion system membrane protein PorP/SprF n=1 Tax=Pontibacter diazotrophicus TaxID=1400979 RepID=A0A3D8L3Q9_9BACT|nr:PorP/SprF family type IX secretion system membrane protein [Pontibacter diazotrophicus]RDV11943.1 type IX secretion system membrane protein PorP/SprF [Pontibacter diazotrophicus]